MRLTKKQIRSEIDHTEAVKLGLELTLQNTKSLFMNVLENGECNYTLECIEEFKIETNNSIKEYEKELQELRMKLV